MPGFLDALMSMIGQGPQQPPTPDYPGALGQLANQPGRQKSLGEFIQSTLQDPNPLHRAGLPLGLLGRAMDTERHFAEGVLGRVTSPYSVYALGKDPVQAWDDNPLSDVPVFGGLLPMVAEPSTYLTLGAGPAAKIATKLGPAAAKIPGGTQALKSYVDVNRASQVPFDWAAQKAGQAAGAVARQFPEAFKPSSESTARELASKWLDIGNFLRQNSWNSGQLASNLGRFRSKGDSRAEVGKAWTGLEDWVAEQVDPMVQSYGTLVLMQARARYEEILRRYEVMRHEAAQEAGGTMDKTSARAVGGWWFDQTRQLQEAARETIQDFARESAGKVPQIPDDQRTWLQSLLQLRHQKSRETINRYTEMAKAEDAAVGPDYLPNLFMQRDRELAVQRADLNDVLNTWATPFAKEGESPDWLRTAVGPEAAANYLQRLQGLGMNSLDPTTGHLGFVPEQLSREALAPIYRTGQKAMNALLRDQQRLADALADSPLLQQVKGDTLPFDAQIKLLQERGVLPNPGTPLTAEELLQGLRDSQAVDIESLNTVSRIVQKWSSKDVDVLNADPFHASYKDVYEATLEASGGPSPRLRGSAGRLLDDATALWKTYGLASPRYHTLNALTGLMYQGMEGYSPAPAMQRAAEVTRRIFSERPDPSSANWLSQASQDHAAAYEFSHPHGLVNNAYQAIMETYGGIKRASTQRMGDIRRMVLGGAMGGVTGGPLGAAAGAVMGKYAPKVEGVNRLFAWVLESNLRLPIWEKEFDTSLAQELPSFLGKVRETLAQPRKIMGSGPGSEAFQESMTRPVPRETLLTPQAIDGITSQLAETNGAFGARKLAQLLDGTATTDQIQALTKDWLSRQQVASDAAKSVVDRIHFDYGKLTTIEETLKQVVPFATWFLHSVPFAARHITEHPVIAMALAHYNSLSTEEVEKAGLPSSFLGYAPTGGLGKLIASAVLGQSSSMGMVNPLQAILPFSDLGGTLARAEREDNPVASALALGRPLGMGFSGPIQAILAASGILGKDEPTPGLLRYSDVPGRAASLAPGANSSGAMQTLDPESWREWIDAQRTRFGQDPFSYHQLAVQRRLSEMSMERTGQVGNPEYLAAVQDPSSPLYREAEGDIYRREFGQTISGSLFPLPFRGVSTTEAAVRKEAQNLPQGPADTPAKQAALTSALQEHPVAGAYSGTAGSPVRNELQQVFAAMNNPAILLPDVPQNLRPLAQDLGAMLAHFHNINQPIPGQYAVNPLVILMQDRLRKVQMTPVYQEYLAWRAAQHPGPRAEGEDALMAQFLSSR